MSFLFVAVIMSQFNVFRQYNITEKKMKKIEHFGKTPELIALLSTYLTANIFESGPMAANPMKIFGQLARHPKLLIGSKLSLG